MKNILVLGGTGFVGTPVCEMLLQQGWQVTVPSRLGASAELLQKNLPEIHVLEFDVHDEMALTQALTGQQAVVNLVAILHGTVDAFEKVHVDLPQKLARACSAAGVRQMVHVSALGADAIRPQSAPSMYLRSKGQGEAVLLQAAALEQPSRFDLTILRPSVVFGVKDKFLNVFAQLQKVLPVMPLAGATTRFQPVWVQDVASAVVRCLERTEIAGAPNEPLVLELCGPDVFTLRQLVQLSARLSGVRGGRGRPVLALPRWLGRLQATLMELAPGEPLMSRDNLDSMKSDNVASGNVPGLSYLGIEPASLVPIASAYLGSR
ncbi:MAG: complex I NDUFA9 subunit family protein [Comamonadaceae bacterium]